MGSAEVALAVRHFLMVLVTLACSPLASPSCRAPRFFAGFRRFFLLGCFLARRLWSRPRVVLTLGAPGMQVPVIGADLVALGVHPLPIPVCAKGTGMLLGSLGVAKPLHRNERRSHEYLLLPPLQPADPGW